MLSLKLSRGAAPSEDPSMSTTYIIEGELNMYICTMYASWAPHIHDTSHHVMWRVCRRLRGSSLLLADRLHRSNEYK